MKEFIERQSKRISIVTYFKTGYTSTKKKYAYGYKFNANRMKRQKIVLPINDEGSLDFDYGKIYADKKK